MIFYGLPGYREIEPNGPEIKTRALVKLPALVNGQIMPGDVDRFRIQATKGQQLVIDLHARQLVPYLADAVPGWFQATLALFNSKGKEVAFIDDYRLNPDPVLFFHVPESGEYLLEVRDSIYRGREDFVYRLRMGELPYITEAFPLGGESGTEESVMIRGYNLRGNQIKLKPHGEKNAIRALSEKSSSFVSNSIKYYAGTLPEVREKEPNNDLQTAQAVSLPLTVNGRIQSANDKDIVSFVGKAGETIVAEVHARRLGSPLDSLLRLYDSAGTVVQWNDDYKTLNIGYLTHQADSYLLATLPESATYYIELSDTQASGSSAHAYRLRISHPIPSISVYVNPSGVNIPAGKTVPVQATAVRHDGFSGTITLSMKQSPGFTLHGGRIPKGRDRVTMTLTAPNKPQDGPIAIQFQAHAKINGDIKTVPCIPADDVMQAFLYRHLVESRRHLAIVGNLGRHLPTYRLQPAELLQLKPGTTISLRAVPSHPVRHGTVRLELFNPPKSIRLTDVTFKPNHIVFNLKTDAKATLPAMGNLIIQAIADFPARPQRNHGRNKKKENGPKSDKPVDKAKTKEKIWTVPLGALPARPYRIVK